MVTVSIYLSAKIYKNDHYLILKKEKTEENLVINNLINDLTEGGGTYNIELKVNEEVNKIYNSIFKIFLLKIINEGENDLLVFKHNLNKTEYPNISNFSEEKINVYLRPTSYPQNFFNHSLRYESFFVVPKQYEDDLNGCDMCVENNSKPQCIEVCPVDCFYAHTHSSKDDSGNTIKKHTHVLINHDECIYCGFCEEVCPRNAIKPDTYSSVSDKNWAEYNEKMLEVDKQVINYINIL